MSNISLLVDCHKIISTQSINLSLAIRSKKAKKGLVHLPQSSRRKDKNPAEK